MTGDRCMWCDEPATVLCDAVIGMAAVTCTRHPRTGAVTLLAGTERDGSIRTWTCDAPMCRRCASAIGRVCFGRKHSDTIDRCPFHVERGEAPLRDLIMFEDEAERRRREVHAEIRRDRIRAQGSP